MHVWEAIVQTSWSFVQLSAEKSEAEAGAENEMGRLNEICFVGQWETPKDLIAIEENYPYR